MLQSRSRPIVQALLIISLLLSWWQNCCATMDMSAMAGRAHSHHEAANGSETHVASIQVHAQAVSSPISTGHTKHHPSMDMDCCQTPQGPASDLCHDSAQECALLETSDAAADKAPYLTFPSFALAAPLTVAPTVSPPRVLSGGLLVFTSFSLQHRSSLFYGRYHE